MVTVYLDEAKWIDLGRAMHGRRGGERFRPALDAAQHCAAMELVDFPLSLGHYIETWRHGDARRRQRLAQTMLELSRGRTLARPPDLCDNELDAVISGLVGLDLPRAPYPALGWGFAHASGLTPNLPRDAMDLAFELSNLANRPSGFDDYGRGHREFGDLYRHGEEVLASGRQRDARSTEMVEAVLAVSAVVEIWENIDWATQRAGLPREMLGPIGQARPDLSPEDGGKLLIELLPLARNFIADMPTRDAVLRLRLERHRNPTNKWESNDMIDIAYLACAAVHCDVLVTERQWVHELRQSRVLDLHGTVALHDVADLPQTLLDLVT
jgi:hypothetical protein